MATFAARVDAAVLHASAQEDVRADINTAVDTFEAAIQAVLVTTVGKTVTDPEYVQVQEGIIDLTEMIASAVTDHAS